MKATTVTGVMATIMLSGCLMAPYPPEGNVVLAPPLPSVVWLDKGPYYYNGGYTYYYHNSSWNYSNHRGGPWRELPLDRYPKEVRHRERDGGQHRERGHNQDYDRRR